MKFGVNLRGRVKNFQLNVNQHSSHFPILEAIINSIQAIHDKIRRENLTTYQGSIVVQFVREPDLLKDTNSKALSRIERVIITDNGIGFDEENFKAFMQTDTDHKSELGGKGVGRLALLKAFNEVNVESSFLSDNIICKRSFTFNENTEEVNDELIGLKNGGIQTKITLDKIKMDFYKNMPVGLDVWANRIIQHCLLYFFETEVCPQITLTDGIETIVLNDVFSDKVNTLYDDEKFMIGEMEFIIKHLRISRTVLEKHKMVLLGNKRSVRDIDLVKSLVDIQGITLEQNYNYLCLVQSSYLDAHVDLNRLAFDLPEEETKYQSIDGILSIEKIVVETAGVINITLKDLLKPVREEKERHIKTYIQTKAQRYAHLLKYRLEDIKNMVGGTDEKIDEQLYRIERKFQEEEHKTLKLLQDIIDMGTMTPEQYEEEFKKCVVKVTDANKSRLTDYIVHRRAIIELFEKGMQKGSDEKYSKESYMHNLIYPMRKTSEDIRNEEQNLWLIDERLSYFYYASSDISFDNKTNEKRTDIMLFDKPISLVDEKNDGTVYDKIVIFELKKPMRDGLQYEKQNPISQITSYKRKIQQNNVKDKNGREIKVDEHTKFYLYVVCDVTEKFKKILIDDNGFDETMDKQGFFRMRDNTYMEILSYDKIINDAKKRNQILFDKLGVD